MNLAQPSFVVCLDVAFANLGVAIWNANTERFIAGQVLSTAPEKKRGGKRHIYVADDNVRRCQELADQLVAIMARYRPTAVLAEMPTGGGQNSKAVSAMGMSLAVVSTVCALRKISLHTFQPTETKRLVGAKGNGKIDKRLVQRFIDRVQPRFLPGLHLPASKIEHVADAAICVFLAQRSAFLRNLVT